MSTALTRSHRFWGPVALAAAAGVVVGGTAVIGVVVSHHDAAEPSAPTVPPAPARTALVIPIPVAPTGMPTAEVATAPRVVPGSRR